MSNTKHTPDNDFEILVTEYVADPNCRPLLWIECETPIQSERDRFINDPRVKSAYKAAIKKAVE